MMMSSALQVERDTAQSMQRLVELDSIKTRMVESQIALQVHENIREPQIPRLRTAFKA